MEKSFNSLYQKAKPKGVSIAKTRIPHITVHTPFVDWEIGKPRLVKQPPTDISETEEIRNLGELPSKAYHRHHEEEEFKFKLFVKQVLFIVGIIIVVGFFIISGAAAAGYVPSQRLADAFYTGLFALISSVASFGIGVAYERREK